MGEEGLFGILYRFGIETELFPLLLFVGLGAMTDFGPLLENPKMALLGGSLMGVGSIMAYGCNIGQGMSGISTLSVESLLAVIGMVAGIGVTTKWMEKNTWVVPRCQFLG